MKDRRHHNNKGYRQIKRGKTASQVEAMARRIFGFKKFALEDMVSGDKDWNSAIKTRDKEPAI